jgi:UPF0716 protein FxsA
MPKTLWAIVIFFLLEIAGFIVVGQLIGLGWTLLLVVLTSLLGIWLIRDQGLRAAYQSMRMMQGARVLNPEKLPNPLRLFAGLLLVLPGFITDTLGLLLLLPWSQRYFERKLRRHGHVYDARRFGGAVNDVEVDVTVVQHHSIEGELDSDKDPDKG